LVLPTFWHYEYADDLPGAASCQSFAASLVAIDDGRTVRLRARDGRVEFDALEVFGHPLCLTLNDVVAQRLRPAPNMPRLTIGDLTIARETWHVTGADMDFLDERDGYLAFAAVRRWARHRGMPRQVFYKSPIEPKPCYLDFDSSLYVRIFVKLMKRLSADQTIRIVEMMPAIDETWLHDAAGERYTCELRRPLVPTSVEDHVSGRRICMQSARRRRFRVTRHARRAARGTSGGRPRARRRLSRRLGARWPAIGRRLLRTVTWRLD
jgi:hypothetical protein